jgi:hypothetical protein
MLTLFAFFSLLKCLAAGLEKVNSFSTPKKKSPERSFSILCAAFGHLRKQEWQLLTALTSLTGSTSCWLKNMLAIFPSPAGMSLTKLSLAGNKVLFLAWELG